ncbi:hypothetical protein ACE6H2_009410 [Prunus campanulata]
MFLISEKQNQPEEKREKISQQTQSNISEQMIQPLPLGVENPPKKDKLFASLSLILFYYYYILFNIIISADVLWQWKSWWHGFKLVEKSP